MVNEILSALRVEPEIRLTVLKQYHGKKYQWDIEESEVRTKTTYRKNNAGEKIEYLLFYVDRLSKTEKESLIDEEFNKHYEKYSNYLMSIRTPRGSWSYTVNDKVYERKKYSYTQGNIFEAFLIHLDAGKNKFINSKKGHQEAIIDLYHALNNTGWWLGGDVRNKQAKIVNNRRLASIESIIMVANELIYLLTNDDLPEQKAQDFMNAFVREQKRVGFEEARIGLKDMINEGLT